jgi:hypothetical protein
VSPGDRLARWSTIVLVAAAVARMCTTIVPSARFDTDPAIDPSPFPGLGPSGSYVLDLLVIAASIGAILAQAAARQRLHPWLVVLAALPGVAIVAHGVGEASDLFRGSTWLAAAFAGVAALHLGRDPVLRRVLIAGVVAVSAPLVFRGLEQAFIEHPATVEQFRQSKQALFAERGWAPESAAARTFERRLMQREASGWFTLANLFSAAMAFGTIVLGGLAIEAVRVRRMNAAAVALLVVSAAACAGLLAMNASKGAIAATAIGGGIVVLGLVLARRSSSASLALPTIVALAAIVLAAASPALRGLLPEDAFGERSLLVRSQYLAGAVAALPEAMPLGLGPDGLQDVYLRTKPARATEDITSTHAMLVDWVVLLGPLGLAWAALVVSLVHRPRTCPVLRPVDEEVEQGGGASLFAGVAIAAGLGLAMLAAEGGTASGASWVVRSIGLAAFVALFVVVDRALASSRIAVVLVLGGVAAVLAQAQVEMLFFQPGMPVALFVLLGAFASFGLAAERERSPTIGAVALAVVPPACAAGIVLVFGLLPQRSFDAAMDRAVEELVPLAEVRTRWPRIGRELDEQIGVGRPFTFDERAPSSAEVLRIVTDAGGMELGSSLRQAFAGDGDVQARGRRILEVLRRFDAGQRAKAADRLLEADAAFPENWTAREAAIKQLAAAGRRTVGPRTPEIVDLPLHAAAIDLARATAERRRSPRFAAMTSDLLVDLARQQPSDAAIAAAREAIEVALRMQPRSTTRTVELGDVLAASGDRDGAIAAWRGALALDDDHELDPLAQMTPGQRADVERRIAAAEAAKRGERTLPAFWPLARATEPR